MRGSLCLLLLTIVATSGCTDPSETALHNLGSFDLVLLDAQGLPVQISELTMNSMNCTRSIDSSALEFAGGTYTFAATLSYECEDGSAFEETHSESGVYELSGHEVQLIAEGDHWVPAPTTAIIENDTLRTSISGVTAVYARDSRVRVQGG